MVRQNRIGGLGRRESGLPATTRHLTIITKKDSDVANEARRGAFHSGTAGERAGPDARNLDGRNGTMSRFRDKIAVVIGGTGGIGKAIVERFAEEGAQVISTGSSDRKKTSESPLVHDFVCDLSDPEAPQRVADHCRATFGRADILVNNAGISIGSHDTHDVPIEAWERIMAVNLRGVFLGMKAFLPMMIEAQAGTIINMGSTSAYRSGAGIGPYCATKAGVIALTKAAALEYAQKGIRVNAVCPGTVQSPMLDAQPEERLAMLRARIPMGRFASTADVAALAAFLASEDAAYITGQGYLLEGGRFAGG